MEEQKSWELVDPLNDSETPKGKVQARAYISRELNEWIKQYYKDVRGSGMTIAHVYGEWLEESIRKVKNSKIDQFKLMALKAFGENYKEIIKDLL